LTYASAGHNPPRLKRCQDGSLLALDGAGGLPLGLAAESQYLECVQQLQPGDQMIFYTDGISEARDERGELFGIERLDGVLENCAVQAQGLLSAVLAAVDEFSAGRQADDDRTLIVGRVY
jgi:sigma-B regulation protein RsbU (phosphoserine phosphatase)